MFYSSFLSSLTKKPHLYWAAALIVVVLSFVLYGNGISGRFILDDEFVIAGNPLINYQLSDFWKIFTSPYHFNQPLSGLYRPLTIASYALNWFAFGNSPASFHVVNILLHALAVWLIFIFVYRLASSLSTASVTALLFMFLPIHVEDVTSLVGRAEILSLIFVVTAFYFVRRERYGLAAAAFGLGLLSKETALSFLPMVIFWEAFYLKRSWRVAVSKLWYFLPPCLIYGLLRGVALGKHILSNDATAIYNPIKFAPILSGWWTSLKVFFLYLQKTFVPLGFSSDYSYNAIPLVQQPFYSWQTLVGLGILLLCAWLLVKKRSTTVGLGVAIFLSSYFVISNWLFKTGTIMAERLMYLPSLGLCLILGGAVSFLLNKKKWRMVVLAAGAVLLVWYGERTIHRNRAWLSESNLFESAYATAPESIVNMTNKAYLYYRAMEYGEARQMIDEVLAMAPDHLPALNIAGHIYKKQGHLKEAEDFWKKSITLRRDFLRAYASLGALYYENQYFQSAEQVLTEAIAIYPRWSEVFLLSLTKSALGKYDEAIALVEKNFGQDPQKELKFALGVAYYKKGDLTAGEAYLKQVKDPKITLSEFLKTVRESKVFLVGEF